MPQGRAAARAASVGVLRIPHLLRRPRRRGVGVARWAMGGVRACGARRGCVRASARYASALCLLGGCLLVLAGCSACVWGAALASPPRRAHHWRRVTPA
eukprot:479324-Prymnesium_polylepis.1